MRVGGEEWEMDDGKRGKEDGRGVGVGGVGRGDTRVERKYLSG